MLRLEWWASHLIVIDELLKGILLLINGVVSDSGGEKGRARG